MIDLPPVDYPYPGQVIVRVLPWAELEGICGRGALACCWPPYFRGAPCAMFLPLIGRGGVSSRTFIVLLRHENWHCNGMKHRPIKNNRPLGSLP